MRNYQYGTISMEDYLFGIKGGKHLGLNQLLLELKKSIFYNANDFATSDAFCEHYICQTRSLIIKEKQIALKNNKLDNFSSKWEQFTMIYDFRGPDAHPHLTD